MALRRPGEVFAGGMRQVKAKLAALHGDEAVQQRRLMTFYLEIVLRPQFPSAPNNHTDRELKTVAAAIDALVEGDTMRAGDLLMGRFKALEESVNSGTWALAQELEVLPRNELGLASEGERHRAAAVRLREAKLQAALESLHGQGRRGG